MEIRSDTQEGVCSVGKLQSGGGKPARARGDTHRHTRTRDGRVLHGGHKIVDPRMASALEAIKNWPADAYQLVKVGRYGGGRPPRSNPRGNVPEITVRRRESQGKSYVFHCRFKAGGFWQMLIFHTTHPDELEMLIRRFNGGSQ